MAVGGDELLQLTIAGNTALRVWSHSTIHFFWIASPAASMAARKSFSRVMAECSLCGPARNAILR